MNSKIRARKLDRHIDNEEIVYIWNGRTGREEAYTRSALDLESGDITWSNLSPLNMHRELLKALRNIFIFESRNEKKKNNQG